MLLFDEMEKTFPYLEKVYQTQLDERDDWLNYKLKYEEAATIVMFTAKENFLQEGSKLHTLFLQAGIKEKNAMAFHLFKWMQINMRFNANQY